jgi:type I restriction enzyme S subunit
MSKFPSVWTQVLISEVLDLNENGKPFQQGWSPQCHSHPAPEGAWGALKTTAIQHGEFWPHENKAIPDHLEPRPHIEVKPGDLLMTCAGPRNRCGVACLVERTPPRLMMSGKMYRFRPNQKVMHAKYLMYFLLTHSTTQKIDRMKTGISDSGLNLTHDRFATLEVPVAPPKEQFRIVAKIEELFSELDKGVESLTTAREQIKIYRQSVLKCAFEGKFTPDSCAQKLTVPVSQEMATQEIEDEGLAPLPQGWKYIRLWRLIDPDRSITYGVIKLGKDFPSGVPTLRSSDVRRLRLDLNAVKRISPKIAGDFQRTFLKGGEVLFTVRGTLGGVAVVPSALAGWNISREVAMLAPAEMLDPTYLQYVLASPQLEAWFKSRLRGVAYTGINLASLREVPIAFCPLGEQRGIVRKIQVVFRSRSLNW